MGALMRARDWSATSLGPPETWPQSLRTAIRLLLTTNHPMFVFWGSRHLCFYNDPYAASLGPEKHPSMLGAAGRAAWMEIWELIGPQIDYVLAGKGATWHEDQLVPIIRHGRLDDVYWTYGYNPIDEEASPNGVGGVLVVCTETTEKVLTGRRLAFQLDLTERLRDLADPVDIMAAAAGLLGAYLGASQVAYAEVDDAGEFAIITRDWNDGTMASNVGRHQLSEFGPMVAELRRGDTVAVADVATDPRTCHPASLASYQSLGVGSFLDTPLLRHGRWVAVLAIMHAMPRLWSAHDQAAVEDVALRTWAAVERARIELALREDEARQALLLGLVRDQRRTEDPEAMMRAASEAVARHLGVHRVGFLDMLDDDTLEFTAGWTDGTLNPLTGRFPANGIGTAYLALVRRGALLGIADVTASPLTADSILAEIGTRAMIGVPIFRHGRWHAGMYVNHAEVRDWTAGEVAIVGEVAEQTWDAVERARAVRQLLELNATLEQRVEERTRERDRAWKNSLDLQLVVGVDGTIRVVNEAWSSILGWQPDDLIGRNRLEFVHPDDHAPTEASSAAASRAELRAFENRYRRRDGSYRWISWLASPEGGLIYASGRDVTAEKAAAAELALTQEQLRRAQKMEAVGQLTGGIAHDFNNMLQGIISALALIQRRVEQRQFDELSRYAGFATTAARQAAALTQRLLAFARRQPLDPRPVDANRLVASMEEMLGRTLGPTIELTTALSDDVWLALCDPNQLENAILNLAINARDAMPDGGRLTIETANARILEADATAEAGEVRPGEYVAIGVTDTGVGMAPEVLAQIFEPFYTTKPLGHGTGLGLSMLYGFVRQSGGFARTSSAPGRGTAMRVYLPRAASPVADPEEPARPPGMEAPPVTGHVLLVEDEVAIRSMVSEALAETGCRVHQAGDGAEALEIVRSNQRIDLLLTDVGLPGALNGSQLADAARELRPGLPVLFITGYAHNAELGSGLLKPGIELMSKPFDLEALAARVGSILERVRAVASGPETR